MKQDKFIRKCGPYAVTSVSVDHLGVRLEVFPAYPAYGDWTTTRYNDEGGGPGVFTSLALGHAFEAFLNQPYEAKEVERWIVKAQKLRKRLWQKFMKAKRHGEKIVQEG